MTLHPSDLRKEMDRQPSSAAKGLDERKVEQVPIGAVSGFYLSIMMDHPARRSAQCVNNRLIGRMKAGGREAITA